MPGPASLSIFCGTWNVNGKQVKEDLSPWLKPKEALGLIPDLYALGFQEFDLTRESFVKVDEDRVSKWDKSILATLNSFGDFVQVGRQQLVGMLLIIYAKKELAGKIEELDSDVVGTGYEGKYGNKGGVGIRFRIGNDTFCFINSHLNAHVHNVERRKNDYKSIVTRMTFSAKKGKGETNKTQEAMELPEGFVASDDRAEESSHEMPLILEGRVFHGNELSLFNHDHVVWLGDLNYRVELPREQLLGHIEARQWDALVAADQLVREIAAASVFEGFEEGRLSFFPTYKFDSGTDRYDSSPKMRLPAYCDRVLWRKDPAIQALDYDSHLELKISDHKPVSAVIRVSLAPSARTSSSPLLPSSSSSSSSSSVSAHSSSSSSSSSSSTSSSSSSSSSASSPKSSSSPSSSLIGSVPAVAILVVVVAVAWIFLSSK